MLTFDGKKISDLQVINLANFLQEGDVIVFNDVKVIKAKLSAKILRNSSDLYFNLDQSLNPHNSDKNNIWRALCRPAKKAKSGDHLQIAPNFEAKILKKDDDGFITIEFNCSGKILEQNLQKYGQTPLPPYIKRDNKEPSDDQNYQTSYAANGTGVAAPTAGLHFNDKVFETLNAKKAKQVFVTLNVGAGTFLPVRSDLIKDHQMHSEFFEISQDSANIINEAKKNGKKIIAIGTTSLRALESSCDKNGLIIPQQTNTNIFIYPPYKFKIVDILMTNFHLPKSTLFMLISAFVGSKNAQEIYQYAIKNNYRFYSYGDSSLLFRQ